MLKIKTNSKEIKNGDTFIAIKGETVDGHDFINEAIKKGATKVICEKGSYNVETVVVNDTKKYLQDYLVENYSKYFTNIKFIGITGTNGKTTTCFLTYQILNNLNVKTAYIGTIGYYVNNEKVNDLKNTTPDILELYNLILDAKEKGVEVIVMEVSSIALDLERIAGLKFDLVGFTNFTQDHLDYHKTMENYLKSKLKILNYIKDDGKLIVNKDDLYNEYFCFKNKLGVGLDITSDYHILKYNEEVNKTNILFEFFNKKYIVETNLLCDFNVKNYLMALSMVNNLGYSIEDIINVTKDVYPPKGRNEVLSFNDNKIVIDYAHTPDAVYKILKCYRKNTTGKIIVVIGCGGNRDKTKRPQMGSIVTNMSDYVIFTNDNPRKEDENLIIKDIVSGVNNKQYDIIMDRSLAIQKGVELLKNKDALLILGKGHEEYQILGDNVIHFSDFDEVNNYINEIRKIKALKKFD